MDLGGFCASGGPYVIAVECPDAVLATTPLSIFGGFLAAGLIIWGGAALGGEWWSLVFLAWPALFLSLGWNFLEYGFFAVEGDWVWSWLFCGVLFVLMGAVPLAIGIGIAREGSGGGGARTRRGAWSSGRGRRARSRPRLRPRLGPRPPPARPDDDEALVDRLERLAAMRRRGDLTTEEFETAKAATLAEAGGRPMNGRSSRSGFASRSCSRRSPVSSWRSGCSRSSPTRRRLTESRATAGTFWRRPATYTSERDDDRRADTRGWAVDQRELVERAQRGDHDAFAVLAGRFVARLDATARLILRDHELARDAVQDGFIRAGGTCRRSAIRIASRAGCASLVVRSCIDILRVDGRRPIEVELLADRRPVGGRHRRRSSPTATWSTERFGASSPTSAPSSSCTTTSGCRCPTWRRPPASRSGRRSPAITGRSRPCARRSMPMRDSRRAASSGGQLA